MKKYILFILISIILIACGPDESNKATLTGSVSLIPSSDAVRSNAGVKVMLFAKVDLDSDFGDIVKDNSGIGTGLSVESLFDHRLLEPEYEVLTGDDGTFSFNDVPKDTYNIVFEYEDYGFRYINDFDLYSNKSLDEIVMHEAVEIYGLKTEDLTLEANRFYYTTFGFSMDSNTRFTIEEGATLQITDGRAVHIKGEFQAAGTQSNPFRIICTESPIISEIDDFDKFLIDSLATVTGPISNGIVSNTTLGFQVFCKQTEGVVIENMTFMNSNYGLNMQKTQNSIVQNCTFVNLYTHRLNAIFSQHNDNLTIEKNIIYKWKVGSDIKDTDGLLYNNNYIDNIEYSGINFYHVNGNIEHCEVYCYASDQIDFDHGVALTVSANSEIEVEYNVFSANSYAIYFEGDAYGGGPSNGDINKNNIICDYVFLYALGTRTGKNNGVIDFTRNCFYTSDLDVIDQKIMDRSDHDVGSYTWQYSADVTWEPLYSDSDGVSTAGIRL